MPHRWVSACIAGLVIFATPLAAQTTLPPITLGGGLRTSFVHDSPDGGDDTNTFALDSARIYISGPVTEQIKFMFNTEYDGASNKIGVLDAVARVSAISATASRIGGIDISPSMNRIRMPSAHRTKPETRPMARPASEANMATDRPTVSETRAP